MRRGSASRIAEAKNRRNRGCAARNFAVRNRFKNANHFDQAMNYLRVEDAVLKRDLWTNGQRSAATSMHARFEKPSRARCRLA